MNEFHRTILSLFVNIYNTDPGRFTGYYEIANLITAYYQQSNTAITMDDIYLGVKHLIDLGFLEVLETGDGLSYRLSLTGNIFWDYNETAANDIDGDVKRIKRVANFALLISVISIVLVLLERFPVGGF